MKLTELVVILSILLSASCNSTKQSTTPDQPVATAESAPPTIKTVNDDGTVSEIPMPDKMCRLTISFISMGEGTDPQAREKMDQVLNSWQEKNQMNVEKEEIPWGREGEVDFCFNLKDLKAEDQARFVKEIKEAFQGNKLVQIAENKPPRFK